MTATTNVTPATRKAKKRADGEGSIRYSESKKLWIGRVMVGRRLDGKPDVREVTAKGQRACRERLDAVKAQAITGSLPSADAAGLTVAAFLDRWLTTVKPNLRQSTHQRYERFVIHHFKPALGSMRLAKLTHHDIEAFLNAKRTEAKKRGRAKTETVLSPRSIRHLFVVLGTALAWGIRKGHLTVNPMQRVDTPTVPRVENVPLTPAEMAKLLNTAEEAGDPLLPLWELAAATGARKGELLGLQWDDIDLDTGAIHIRRTLVKVLGRKPVFDDPKTARSYRTVEIAAESVESLRRHRDRQAFDAARLGDAYAPFGLVFATSLGTALGPESVSKRFKTALRRAELAERTRVHDLRHGCAMMLLEAGESVPTVAEYLGHASPAVTMAVYAHAVPGARKRAADRLGAIIRRARSQPEVVTDEVAVSS
jgi:integrase